MRRYDDAGADAPPQNPPPHGWPFINSGPSSSALIEPTLEPIGAGDPRELQAHTPDSAARNRDDTIDIGAFWSPGASVRTPATSLTSSPGSLSGFSSDEGGDGDDGHEERHVVARHLWGMVSGSSHSTNGVGPLLELLFTQHQQWRQNPPLAHTNAQSHAGGGTDTRNHPLQPFIGTVRQANIGEGGSENEESEPINEIETEAPDSHSLATLFACPFWKRHPSDWRDCFGKKLKRIKDVKQHLRRVHTKCHCEQCGIEFDDGAQLHNHLSNIPPCQPQLFRRKRLSGAQQQALKKRSTGTLEGQWYAIWDIIFPSHRRPFSPYLDGSLSEDLSSFLEFYLSTGAELVRQSSRPNHLGDVFATEATVQHYLQMGLQLIYDRWASATGHSASMVQAVGSINAMSSVDNQEQSMPEMEIWQHNIAEEDGLVGGFAPALEVEDVDAPPGMDFFDFEAYNDGT